MINWKMTGPTKELLTSFRTGSFFKREILPKVDLVQFGVVAKEAVQANLTKKLGEEKMKHFRITTIGSNLSGINISVEMDDIGNFIYGGTKEHMEFAHNYSMKFEWDGEQIYASEIHHPGTEPLRNDILETIRATIYELIGMMR